MAILSKLGGAVALCAFMPGLAMANTATPASHMDITAGGTVAYQSNAARSSAARAAARGLHRSEETFSPSIGIDLLHASGRATIGVTASAGYDFHSRNTQLNRERLSASANAGLAVAICNVGADVSFSRRQSDLGDIGFDPTVSAGVKNTETVQHYGGTLTCGNIIGISPTVSVSRDIGENSNLARARAEYRAWNYTGGLVYQNPVIGTLTVFVSRRDTEYPHRLLLSGGADGNKTDSYGVKFARDIGARLKGSVSLSETELKPRNTLVTRSSKGLSWSADLTATVSSQLQLHGLVSRSLVNSLATDSAYHVDKIYSLDANYAINERMMFAAGYSYRTADYVTAGIPTLQALNNDKRNTVFSSLTYNQSTHLSFSLNAGYEDRKADNNFYNYNNTHVSLGAQFKF